MTILRHKKTQMYVSAFSELSVLQLPAWPLGAIEGSVLLSMTVQYVDRSWKSNHQASDQRTKCFCPRLSGGGN